MKEEIAVKNDITRADQAKDLINNPLYIEAMNLIEAAIYAEFRDTKLESNDLRHELWQRMQVLKLFKGRFENIIKHGKRAEQTLDLINKQPKAE